MRAHVPRLLLVAVIVAAGALLAACGDSRSPSNAATKEQASEQKAETKFVDFARCLREHGVNAEAISHPGGGHGIKMSPGNGSLAAAEAAEKLCARYRPPPQNVNVSPQQKVEQEEVARKFVKCMRSHGMPNFPEPKVITIPGGGQKAYIAEVNMQSPAFQAAAKVCGGPKG
jgi:hypothetical protein